jgi:hypothetical protein
MNITSIHSARFVDDQIIKPYQLQIEMTTRQKQQVVSQVLPLALQIRIEVSQ